MRSYAPVVPSNIIPDYRPMARFQGQNKVYGYHANLIAKYIVILRDDFQLMTSVDMLCCNGILSLRHDF